jgi:hypothetical protein
MIKIQSNRTRLLGAALILLGLCGCVSREIQITRIGVMELRTHRMTDHIDWESNTWVDKEEICPPSGKDCVSAKQFYVKESNGVLYVGINEALSPEKPFTVYFFNTKTGAQLRCEKCRELMSDWWVWSGYWLEQPQRFVAFSGRREEKKAGLFVAKVVGDKIEARIVPRAEQPNVKENQAYGNSISPDNRSLAWYECSPKCTLFWLSEDYVEILSEATTCASKDLEVYWRDGRPMVGFSARTSKFETCRDDKGKLRYPLLPWKY